MLQGIDVSKWQTEAILRAAIKSENPDFVICKASEGISYKDSKFQSHMSTADSAGKLLGAYHFCRPENGNSAKGEAGNFINACANWWGKIIPCLDLEGASTQYPGAEDWAFDFLEEIFHHTGLHGVIYCGTEFARKCTKLANNGYYLWLARWTSTNKSSYWGKFKECLLWQHRGEPLDLDTFYGSKEDWLALTMPPSSALNNSSTPTVNCTSSCPIHCK